MPSRAFSGAETKRPPLTLGSLSLAVLALSVGCAHRPARAARKLAIMPIDPVGVDSREARRFEEALRQKAREHPGLKPTPAAQVRRALAPTKGSIASSQPRSLCLESDTCLAALGKRLAADLVLGGTVAGLGDQRVLRMRLVRTRDGIVLQDLQQTTRGGALFARAASQLTQRLFPRDKSRAWYRRWWVWTAVAAVVSASVGVGWWAAEGGSGERDPTVVHLGDL